jgi:hypothetical protein
VQGITAKKTAEEALLEANLALKARAPVLQLTAGIADHLCGERAGRSGDARPGKARRTDACLLNRKGGRNDDSRLRAFERQNEAGEGKWIGIAATNAE